MKKFLTRIIILIVGIFVLLIIAWRIHRTFFHPYIPNFNEQIRSDVTDLKFTVPKDKESCEEKNGLWKKIGLGRLEECNLPTKDGGKICLNTKECEGVCLADITNDQLREGMRGKLIKTNGICSRWIKIVGCHGYVYQGWASVVCVD